MDTSEDKAFTPYSPEKEVRKQSILSRNGLKLTSTYLDISASVLERHPNMVHRLRRAIYRLEGTSSDTQQHAQRYRHIVETIQLNDGELAEVLLHLLELAVSEIHPLQGSLRDRRSEILEQIRSESTLSRSPEPTDIYY